MKFDILNVLKGGMRFPKNKEKFLQEMGGARNDGVDFIMGGGGGFLKSLYIVGRGGANPPYFMKTPLYCLPHFFKFCPPASPPTSLSPPTPTPTPTVLSVVLFLWLNG